MTTTAEAAAAAAHLTKLGLVEGAVVQELGYDDDVDLDLRDRLMEHIGSDLVDEDHGDVVDAVLFWHRDGDGDLVDAVVDGLTDLDDQGFIVLMTPRAGRDGQPALALLLWRQDIRHRPVESCAWGAG